MKILATSDMHGMLDNIDLSGIDVALFAGDIAPLKGLGPWHVHSQVKWMNSEFYDFCSSHPSTQVLFVPGNHDFFPRELAGHNVDVKFAPNAKMLVDAEEVVEAAGQKLRVYGTSWVPVISHSWAFEAEHDALADKFSKIPMGVDVLLTHTPPRYGFVDVSLEHGIDSEKFGSHELANEIFKKKPKMCFCGHIHSGDHNVCKLGETEVYNVSRVDESYCIAYEPLVVDLST